MPKRRNRSGDSDENDPDYVPQLAYPLPYKRRRTRSIRIVYNGPVTRSKSGGQTLKELCNKDAKRDFMKHFSKLAQPKNIKDLIGIAEKYENYRKSCIKEKRNCYMCEKYINLVNALPALRSLDEMVGMEDLKQSIFYQIMYFVQKLGSDDMLHTAIFGSPGTGKTTVARILADLYASVGILKNRRVVYAKRSTLIAKYCGQTAIKTEAMLRSALGGVFVIDEAYSLGNGTKGEDFTKECIDTINQFLTEHKNDIACIICGYEEELERCFFSYNPGLRRRFPWRHKIKPYTPSQLLEIFLLKIKEQGWKINAPMTKLSEFFKKHKERFKFYGGSIMNLLTQCKMCHARRIFVNFMEKKELTIDDVEQGFELYVKCSDQSDAGKQPFYII